MKTKKKWFNDPNLVGTLLFVVPPLGMYGLYKSETIHSNWKKVTFAALFLALILLIINYLF